MKHINAIITALLIALFALPACESATAEDLASMDVDLIQGVAVSYALAKDSPAKTPCGPYQSAGTGSLQKTSSGTRTEPFTIATWNDGQSTLPICGILPYWSYTYGDKIDITRNCTVGGVTYSQQLVGKLDSFRAVTLGSIRVTRLSDGCQNLFITVLTRP